MDIKMLEEFSLVVIFILGAFLVITFHYKFRTRFVCKECGSFDKVKRVSKGNILIALILLCFFIIPGLIYIIWASGHNEKACSACGSSALIPENSPLAKTIRS